MWFCTVFTDRNSSRAISALARPRATWSSISVSRAENWANGRTAVVLSAALATIAPTVPLNTSSPSATAASARAIALRYAKGPQGALAELKELVDVLERYPLLYATHAKLLRALGRPQEARQADERALELTANPAQQALLEERLSWT